MSTPGEIPQSTALAEATVDSLGELMSRDPEGYSTQDLERIVAAMRDQRDKLAATAAATPQRAPRGTPKAIVTLNSTVAPEDIGL